MSAPGPATGARPALQIQSVLFGTGLEALERVVVSSRRAALAAQEAGDVGPVSISVGDCSPQPLDGATELLGRHSAGLATASYRHFGENLGHGGGHNRLFAASHASLFLLLNPDTYASPRLVRELVAGLLGDVGLVEGRQLPLEHPKAHDRATGDTSWASGSCVLVRAEVVAATGGFDAETFFMHGDDTDFSWRTRLAGWRVVHRPSATVFHDKRLNPYGQMEIGPAEVRWSAEASVLLASRYGRPDLVRARLEAMAAAEDPALREAAGELQKRLDAGELPQPLPGAERVAQFVGGEYAVHRFGYAGQ